MTRARSLPSITSVPISGRAGVPMEAPETDMSSTLALEPDALGELQRLQAVPGRGDALVAALLGAVELGAVGEPSQGAQQAFRACAG